MPQARALRTLRVQCYAPGCQKSLPQKLVLSVSFAARLLADAIDKDEATPSLPQQCGSCGLECAWLTNTNCGHGACENCWELWANVQAPICKKDGRLRAKCLQPDCSEGVPTMLWDTLLTKTSDVQTCIEAANKADAEMARLGTCATFSRLLYMRHMDAHSTQPGPVCPICQEHRFGLLHSSSITASEHAGNDGSCCTNHIACEDCWTRWTEEQLQHCRSERAVRIRCIECTGDPDSALWKHVCSRSPAVAELDGLLSSRRRLQKNVFFPPSMQVNCPQPGCVGLGYLGYDTVMCFLCEHQWSPEDHVGEPPPNPDVEIVMGIAVKRCPNCAQYIEKNGGCDHMTCQHPYCGHQFWWSTLKPYRL